MAIVATDTGGGGDFTPVPQGTHIAICDQVVDLGKQVIKSAQYGESIKHQVYIRWQIPEERYEYTYEGEKREGPSTIGKTYTVSLGEKANLRKDLQAWRGKPFTPDELRGFDIAKLLGVPATITVTHTEKDGRTFANIASVGGIPKGMPKPAMEGEGILYDGENLHNFEKLTKKMQERVGAQIMETGQADPNDPDAWRGTSEDVSEDVPF